MINPSDTILHRDSATAGTLASPWGPDTGSLPVAQVKPNVSEKYVQDTIPAERFITANDPSVTPITPRVIAETPSGITTVLLTGGLFLAALLHFADKNLFGRLFRYLDISHPGRQQPPVGEIMPLIFRVALFAMVPLVYSIFAVLIFSKFNVRSYIFQPVDLQVIVLLYAIIFAYLAVKSVIIRIAGSIFKTKGFSKKYNAGQFVFNVVTSLLLLPVLWIMPYDQSLTTTYLAIFIYIVLFIIRMMRNAFIAKEEDKYSLFHFFIYFCTLEILPVLLIIKAFLDYNKL